MPRDRENLYCVYALRHGTRTATRAQVYLDYAAYGEPDGPHVVDYFYWVLKSATRTILVDTGFAGDVARRRSRVVLHDPMEMLEELNIDPSDVDTVIVTHCHYDHIGNLGRFPNASIHMGQAEMDFIRSGSLEHRLVGHFTEPDEVALVDDLDSAGRLIPVCGETELTAGIRLSPVGGHTPGQLMVEVDTDEGTVLLASDALHFIEELERDMPFASSMDVPATYRAFDTIRSRLANGVSHLIAGHDASTLSRMRPVATDIGVIG